MSGSIRRKRRVRKTVTSGKNSKARLAFAILAFFLSAGIITWVLTQQSQTSSNGNTSFEALRSVSVLEMPALAVDLVQASDVGGRDAKIQEVLKSVSVLARPGVLPYMVAALVQSFPTNLEVILGTAIDLQPDLVLIYTEVAAYRLPSQIENISYVVGKKSPWNATGIAQTLAQQTHDLDAITRGLKRGIPEYQPTTDAPGSSVTAGFVAIPSAQGVPPVLSTNQSSSATAIPNAGTNSGANTAAHE